MKKTIASAAIIGLFSPMIANAADIASASDVHIRSLAASCAACHGTQGNAVSGNNGADSIPALAGVQKADIIAQLTAFKSGERPATVMQRHAKGLTSDEITALAEYFSRLAPKTPVTLKSQKLQADHAN
ncbi:c-type cytochrome [Methylotenera sp. G11]|uniref:c-type cytochrome n=1 Tax=Methylotenera sp. G11 TaxID=1506585 RepID=UPI0006489D55|nr:c-type cytochrome [Methylotenera sp. G11]